MDSQPDLVLLTARYPSGNKSETFLETELPVLAERFRSITLLPAKLDPGSRELPPNVEVVRMDWLSEPTTAAKYRALGTREALSVASYTARVNPVMRRRLASRMYADLLAREVLKFRSLRRLVRERDLGRAIFYSYWLEEGTLALALLRRSGAIRAAVSRAHGFDVYEFFWGGPVPFQDFKGAALDRIYPVSAAGARHLEEVVPSMRGKLEVKHLGVSRPAHLPQERHDKPLVVSCSSLIGSKRVELIPDVLRRVGRPLRWVHFGDGPERERVEAAAASLEPPVEFELAGHVDNRAVLRFYEQNAVDALLSLSVMEGLPVSMMEAQSFGIPIVACDAGGVGEIVNAETGVLLPASADPAAYAAALGDVLGGKRLERDSVRAHFSANFDATINYGRFADALIALWKAQAAAA